MKRKIIAIDIDDVIAQGTEAFRLRVNLEMGVSLSREAYMIPDNTFWGYYERVWEAYGLDAASVPLDKIDAEMALDQSHVPLLPGAAYAIGELAKHYDIAIITARDTKWKNATHKWLADKFGDVFIDIYFAGNSLDKTAKTKGQACREVGAEWLIDDNPEHCITAQAEAVKAILFGDYGWHHEAPKDITRCSDWPAVLDYFNAI